MYKFLAIIIAIAVGGAGYFFFFDDPHKTIHEPTIIENTRIIKSLNHNWQFIRANPDTAHSLPKTKWKHVSLPHTWNAKDGQDGGADYYRGTGLYKRSLSLDESFRDKKIYLHFDGATTAARVYVNGEEVGSHKGNYAAFRFDITKQVKLDQENIIVVTVNNEIDNNVAPLSADFTFFGGLYRKVRLIATAQVHVDSMNYASSGVFWSQTDVTKAQAKLTLKTTLVNESNETEIFSVITQLLDKDNNVVAKNVEDLTLDAGQSLPYLAKLSLDNPHLWHGLRDPYLYDAQLIISRNGQSIDQINQPLGLRFFRIDKDRGFILNGESYPLYGINRMADFPNKGTAVNQENHETDIQLILELGATGVRLGHQQRDEYVYRRADETGLVIWAEVPLINRINTNTEFTDNVKQQALELVRQNYNHSSIMFWGLFNEITLKPGPDPRPLVKELNELVKIEDPTRLTTAAVVASGDSVINDPLVTTTDITSFNRYYGWYYGDFNDFTKFMDHAHHNAPDLPIALSEFGAGASTKIHTDDPVMQDHSEEYQAIFHENYWQDLSQRPYVWGKFLWVLADFAVDNRNEGDTPGRNDKGLVTFDRKIKKDAFYWYKANWSKDDVVYITGRRFNVRTRKTADIKVYSNQESLELIVNGQSLGMQKLNGARKIAWSDTPLKLGVNTIEVITVNGDIADSIELTRINSSNTKIRSSLLGVDGDNGKIYNLPDGITFSQLTNIVQYPQGSNVSLVSGNHNQPLTHDDLIRVLAEDGKTSKDYSFSSAPISMFKQTSASAEISGKLSIGPIDIPEMSAAKANDGIITGMVDDMDEVNIWTAMGKGPHWWKVDLGSEYYLESIEITWPQHISMLDTGPMSYSIEIAKDFKQSFDNFSESYQELLNRTDNKISGTTFNDLAVEARFVRVRLHSTQTFADTQIMGKYPIYGAEEISVIGGLLKSNSVDIDYKRKTIDKTKLKTLADIINNIEPTTGGSLQIVDDSNIALAGDKPITQGVSIIVTNKAGTLKERYSLQ